MNLYHADTAHKRWLRAMRIQELAIELQQEYPRMRNTGQITIRCVDAIDAWLQLYFNSEAAKKFAE